MSTCADCNCLRDTNASCPIHPGGECDHETEALKHAALIRQLVAALVRIAALDTGSVFQDQSDASLNLAGRAAKAALEDARRAGFE